MDKSALDESYKLKAVFGVGELEVKNPALLHKLADAALVPVTEVAKLGAVAVRVLALPFRAAEAYGERLLHVIKNAEAQVPPERQIGPAPSIAGPILENVKHLENGNPLIAMYENLLARTMDRERLGEAHPAFPNVLQQLSPDEAHLLFLIKEESFQTVHDVERVHRSMPLEVQLINDDHRWMDVAFPEYADMYLQHLEALNLITSHSFDANDPEREPSSLPDAYAYRRITETHLTSFGALFAKACMPSSWPKPPKEEA